MATTKLAPKKSPVAKAAPRRNSMPQASRTQVKRPANRPMTRSEAGRLGAEARWGRSYPAKTSRSSSARTEARRPLLGRRVDETRRETQRPLSRVEREERSIRRPVTRSEATSRRTPSRTSRLQTRPTLRSELQKRNQQGFNRNVDYDFDFEVEEDLRSNRGRQTPAAKTNRRNDDRLLSNERRPTSRARTTRTENDSRDRMGRFSNTRRNYR